MTDRGDCAEIRELLPELAAGVAAGDERARALRHLSRCLECRRELDAMAAVVDELLTLVPPVEPPGGFESTVLARVAPARRWWRRRALRLAIAGVLAVGVGAGAGAAVVIQSTADDRRVASQYRQVLQVAGGRYLTVRRIAAPDGSDAGRVFAYQGTPSWVFVVLRHDRAVGAYQVHLMTRDGQDRILGEMNAAGGEGSWGVAIDARVAQIAEIRLSGAAGPPFTAVFH
ncbi:MAG TPA: zf-HC2 domain-containing protein [Micromonosporaceae bacterium]|nr:zf-HC2 domain-containing protein [Micromonosporaceae bacterium]